MPGGGTITISAVNRTLGEDEVEDGLAPGDYVELTVADTGSGIAPEALEKVFEPFFTTKAEGLGTGLGLSMVYGFLKQSGGHVAISSTVGAGTRVALFLPRAAAAAPAPAPEPQRRAHRRNARILVVEDDTSVLGTVNVVLGRLGHDVVFAQDGRSALELLRHDRAIELLFTDVVMPNGMYGSDLAIAARAVRPDLKLLFTSGNPDMTPAGTRERLCALGTLLPKPWNVADLSQAIEDALAPAVSPDDRRPGPPGGAIAP